MTDFSDIQADADIAIFDVFGKACTYTPSGGAGYSVTAIIDYGQDDVSAGPGELSERMDMAHIIVSDLSAAPGRGDAITDGTNTWTVERIDARDEDDLVVTLELLRT